MKRIFVVGCSRSGTTIVQRELCSALGLFSLPETAYFSEGLATAKQRLSAMQRWSRGINTIGLWISQIGICKLMRSVFLSRKQAAKVLIEQLDYAAHSNENSGWVEKNTATLFLD